MTVPAKYTLTEAHFRIVELEREAAEAEVEAADARHEKIWQRAKAAEAERDRLRDEIQRAVRAADRGVPTRAIEIIRAALGEDA